MRQPADRFVREGDFWTIVHRGRSLRIKDSKGLRYLGAMLADPGREFHVMDLVAAAAGDRGRPAADGAALRQDGLNIATHDDAGPILDPRAKAEFRRRLHELSDEIEEAQGFNDSARAERARQEMDALEQQLTSAFGLGGKARKVGSVAERARVNVRNNIAAALRAISKHDADLGEHLTKTIRTGTFCWYAGDADRWATSASISPAPIADDDADHHRFLATLLSAEMVEPSARAGARDAKRWGALREQHDAIVRAQVSRHKGHLVRVSGDNFLCTFASPAQAIKCASALHEALDSAVVQMRCAIHAGECERDGDDLAGVGVLIATRIAEEAHPGETLVSSTVRELVAGSGIDFEDRGFHSLRGVPGIWRVFAPVSGRARAKRSARGDAGGGLSLLLVDDHPMWRQTLRIVLEGSGVGIVVAEASDGEEAVEMAASARPQAVVMDMNLGAVNGVEATRRLLAILPETRVLMLSSSDERADVLEAVRAGASGYLLKTASPDEVADAVRRTAAGELVFPPALANVVIEEFRRRGRATTARAKPAPSA